MHLLLSKIAQKYRFPGFRIDLEMIPNTANMTTKKWEAI